MKQFWNKNEITKVAALMKENGRAAFGGILFIKHVQESTDPAMLDLQAIVQSSGGAFAARAHREQLAEHYVRGTSDLGDWVIDNSLENQTVLIVVLTEDMFSDKNSERINFIIAHEIGHHVLGHTAVEVQPELGTPEYIEREVQADQFAASVLGSSKERNETLGYMRTQLDKITEGGTPEFIEKVTAMLDARIDWSK